ncbi:MAG TPA: class I SAM-dependent methyltransferase [Ramlibacter sp.]|jgi:SAM-dependent methyltransferase
MTSVRQRIDTGLKHYGRSFFAWQEEGSIRSARRVLGLLKSHLLLSSVVDVGCGTGGWLKVWQELGVQDVVGVDGLHIKDEQLHILAAQFERRDLSRTWHLGRRFDLVQSMEVAEHLAPESGPEFVASLCALGDVVLFSAAQPGQGGEFHVNERPLAYWQALFESQEYRTFDLRRLITNNKKVSKWYRHNSLLFANNDGYERLSSEVRSLECTRNKIVTSYGDWMWEARRAVVRWFLNRWSPNAPNSAIRSNAWSETGTHLKREAPKNGD